MFRNKLNFRINKILILAILILSITGCEEKAEKEISLINPDENIEVKIAQGDEGKIYYEVFHHNTRILERSLLGLVREDTGFFENLEIVEVSEKEEVSNQYSLLHGKQKEITYEANKYVVQTQNKDGEKLNIIFQLSDDGIAFRYHFPGDSGASISISEEKTAYHFPEETRGWLQPMSVAKTGWSETNPSYEENYSMDVSLDTEPEQGEGWVYPALFKIGESWVLISETGLEKNYSGTRLKHNGEALQVTFPQEEEVMPGGDLKPNGELPFYSPWRIISIGDLETITASTLGTDLAEPAKYDDIDYIRPGFASWSWALLKDESVNYDTTKEYIDYAANMEWEYCLIDVNWDTRIGWERMEELVNYAKEKEVKLLVWYNSSGEWNSTPYTPKSELLTKESRDQQFSRLREIGIAGVKIDFFGGDGRSVIEYYHDILQDAAEHKLLVNFHGATLPRGWHRTYPNLMTVEAIKGHEFTTFEQGNADLAPSHGTMLPFSRNVYDPMDYTPMVLDTIPDIHRRTTSGYELALPVLFLSGVQHIAETPDGLAKEPDYVKEYLKDIPVQWDESRLVEGFPGKDVVMARRKGNDWFVVGINGENEEKTFNLQLDFIGDTADGVLITDGENGFSRSTVAKNDSGQVEVSIKPYGGFVLKTGGI